MENFKDLVQRRRSVRKFTDEEIKGEDLQTILRAALMSPTGKSVRGWHFIVIDDKSLLEKISLCRSMGSQFLAGAAVAIVVLGDRASTLLLIFSLPPTVPSMSMVVPPTVRFLMPLVTPAMEER